jgi:hypothetical protein
MLNKAAISLGLIFAVSLGTGGWTSFGHTSLEQCHNCEDTGATGCGNHSTKHRIQEVEFGEAQYSNFHSDWRCASCEYAVEEDVHDYIIVGSCDEPPQAAAALLLAIPLEDGQETTKHVIEANPKWLVVSETAPAVTIYGCKGNAIKTVSIEKGLWQTLQATP